MIWGLSNQLQYAKQINMFMWLTFAFLITWYMLWMNLSIQKYIVQVIYTDYLVSMPQLPLFT